MNFEDFSSSFHIKNIHAHQKTKHHCSFQALHKEILKDILQSIVAALHDDNLWIYFPITFSISDNKPLQLQTNWQWMAKYRSQTHEAPTPTNISTNFELEIEKKGTLASPTIALASKVFPIPRGPISKTPLGILMPTTMNLFGLFKNSITSMNACFAWSTLATSPKVTPMFGSIWNFALDFPKANGFLVPPSPPRPCDLRFRKKRDATSKTLQPKCGKQLHVETSKMTIRKKPNIPVFRNSRYWV